MEDPCVMYIVVNKSLNMSPGKIAAQVGHLTEKLALDAIHQCFGQLAGRMDKIWLQYLNTGTTKIVKSANSEEWLSLKEKGGCCVIVDEGRTEVPPNSETVLGFFPMYKSEVPEIIRSLRLL